MLPNRPLRQPTPTALLCELAKLRSQQHYLDHGHGEFEKYFPPDIETNRNDINASFDEYRSGKWSDVRHISDTIGHFRQTMLSTYGLQCHRTSEFRDEILRIDTMLRDVMLKNAAEMTELTAQRAMGTHEVDAIEMAKLLAASSGYRLNVCSVGGNVPIGGFHKTGGVDDRQRNLDVQRFFDFLTRHNGHSGGWSNEEHQLYVRAKAKYGKNVPQIIKMLQTVIGAEVIEQNVLAHDIWYQKYIELKQNYRKAIQEWKQQTATGQPKLDI